MCPAVVDMAAMRDAMAKMGGDPSQNQSAVPLRAGDRSLGASRLVTVPRDSLLNEHEA